MNVMLVSAPALGRVRVGFWVKTYRPEPGFSYVPGRRKVLIFVPLAPIDVLLAIAYSFKRDMPTIIMEIIWNVSVEMIFIIDQ